MCGTGGVYRRLSTAKKCRQTIKHENFLRHWLLQTPRRRNYKEKKKNDLSLAIGEKIKSKKRKYILLLILSLIVFVS